MPNIPTHKSSEISDSGVFIKSVTPDKSEQPKVYSHSDDYYIFGMVNEGICSLNIDFKDYNFGKDDMFIIRAGQVHKIINYANLATDALIVDGALLTENEKQTLEQYSTSKIRLSAPKHIGQLFSILADRKEYKNQTITQRLAKTIIAFIIEQIESHHQPLMIDTRYEIVTLQFRELLHKYIRNNRTPSYYAELLHISTSYLNECIKGATGLSTSNTIQNEIILLAKRQLAYTTITVKEIAQELGFYDYSYFTRLFTHAVGISPTLFRKRFHE